jgi:diadenylate cyclase
MLDLDILRDLCAGRPDRDTHVLEHVLTLCVEIAREGREGRKVGTLFTVGDADAVLARSVGLILDPLGGHPTHVRCVDDPDLRETVKELAQLDGAFVISGDGVALSAARYLDAPSRQVKLPLGLGARHMAAASISHQTRAVAFVVSESSVVRVFDGGELVAEVLPGPWLAEHAGAPRRALYAVRAGEKVSSHPRRSRWTLRRIASRRLPHTLLPGEDEPTR